MLVKRRGLGLWVGWLWASATLAAPPTPDHVVIVIEENHSFQQVIGSAAAPYMNQLAQQGALLTSLYAITHPSQPNYLEFYSGTAQGITNDNEPAGVPFSTPNLGAALIAAGASFVGYSEDLPGAGSMTWTLGAYARKHVPWTNWQLAGATPGSTRVPPEVNQPMSAFPADFSLLPRVSIVVPNLNNDMHDGTIAQADAWLAAHLGAYETWAMDHNSLLIVTWDEDESAASRNRIPTILRGPMVRPGVYDSVWTLHNLHRTIADMFGAAPSGAAASVQPITGIWTGERLRRSVRFRRGLNGTVWDTFIEQANPGTGHSTDARLVTDGSPVSEGLIRFEGVFGTGTGLIPASASVVSSKVTLLTGNLTSDNSANTMGLYRMLAPWSEAATWTGMVGGINTDGVECASAAEFSATPAPLNSWQVFDSTVSVRAWAAAAYPNAANLGWAILPTGTDGWRFNSSEAPAVDDRPLLEITIECGADFDASGTLTVSDVFAYLNSWFAADPLADVDGVDGLQVADIFAFLNAWFGGC